jgi:tripartite-type tricarboxylate transporter receptor subunit TctC
MTKTSYVCFAVAACGALAWSASDARAQGYPNQPIRLIVPYAAGGGVDLIARAVAPKLTEKLGQPVVIDNRGGAGGNIGTELAARTEPNGYTLVMGAAALAINVSLYRKLPFDPVKDFAPISLLAATPNILAVHTVVPSKSVKELIALAKSKPGGLNYASAGNGTTSHLAAELFKTMAGVDIVHIPYKGTSPAVVALLSGEAAIMLAPALTLIPHIRANRVKGLAVTGAKRSPAIPELPTVAESGVPGFEARQWYGALAPAGTPAEIVARLNKEMVAIVQSPEVAGRLQKEGSEPIGSTPDEFARYIKAEIAKWAKVVRASGAQLD